MKKILILCIGVIVIVAVIFVWDRQNGLTPTLIQSDTHVSQVKKAEIATENTYTIATITYAHGTIKARIAETSEQQSRGLGGMTHLGKNDGMLFPFATEGLYSFWMKDMLIPIDMVWINSRKKIIGITRNVSPDSFPNTFMPPAPIAYVLEIAANASNDLKLATGTQLQF